MLLPSQVHKGTIHPGSRLPIFLIVLCSLVSKWIDGISKKRKHWVWYAFLLDPFWLLAWLMCLRFVFFWNTYFTTTGLVKGLTFFEKKNSRGGSLVTSFCYATEFGTYAVLYREPLGEWGLNKNGTKTTKCRLWAVHLVQVLLSWNLMIQCDLNRFNLDVKPWNRTNIGKLRWGTMGCRMRRLQRSVKLLGISWRLPGWLKFLVIQEKLWPGKLEKLWF